MHHLEYFLKCHLMAPLNQTNPTPWPSWRGWGGSITAIMSPLTATTTATLAVTTATLAATTTTTIFSSQLDAMPLWHSELTEGR